MKNYIITANIPGDLMDEIEEVVGLKKSLGIKCNKSEFTREALRHYIDYEKDRLIDELHKKILRIKGSKDSLRRKVKKRRISGGDYDY